nr:hypothetical protein [uncultured Acetatifactor sp.]
MRGGERMLLTLEERLERSARSQAASPETAARLVERFSGLPPWQLFFGKPDVDAMYGLTGEFWEHPDVDMDSYHGFSHSFRLAAEQDNAPFRLPLLGLSPLGVSRLEQPPLELPRLEQPRLEQPRLEQSPLEQPPLKQPRLERLPLGVPRLEQHPLELPRLEQPLLGKPPLGLSPQGLPSQGQPSPESPNPYKPVWGVRVNNALILLGLMLLDHTKGRLKPKGFYYCTRMTLGQYLDALAGVGLWTDGSPGLAQGFQVWRDMLLADYGAASPLGETLADILRRYMAAWQEFDHLDHILRCIGALSCYLEQEEAGRTLPGEETDRVRRFREALCQYGSDLEGWELVEQDKRYLDPKGYYFTLACEYPEDLPNPCDRNAAPGSLRSQIFLSERDYSPETLRRLAAGSPSPNLRTLLERYICEERLASAMREVNTAVADIYVLFVEPYLRIGGAGAEPPQNLPTAAAAGRTVFPPE